MSDATRERRIARSIEQVWSVLADFGSIARWAPDVDHSCLLTEQPTGVDTARRVQVGRMTLVERVITWEPGPPGVLAYEIEGLPAALGRVSNRWSLEAAGDGGTVATLNTRVEGSSRPLRVVARVAAARMAKASESMLAGLERYVTTRSEATA